MSSALSDTQLSEYVTQAVEMSVEHVAAGGIPFTALVVDPQQGVVASGVNRVSVEMNPVAHAEVVALREAGADTQRPWPAGCVLLASGEPCALCYVNALFARVTEVIYAVDRHEAASHGFDYRGSYRLLAQDPTQWPGIKVRKMTVPKALEPFKAFR